MKKVYFHFVAKMKEIIKLVNIVICMLTIKNNFVNYDYKIYLKKRAVWWEFVKNKVNK